jgi:transposase
MPKHRQGDLLPMEKFREILRLHDLGYSQGQIARSCAVARSTVQDYVRRATAKGLSYEQLHQLSDAQAKALLGKGQRQVTSPPEEIAFEPIHQELQRKGVTLALLWQEGVNAGQWNLSYASFCRRYNQWKGRHNLSMRQVHKAGEKLYVDYCGMTVVVHDPITQQEVTAEIFVAALGASNYTFAEATPGQSLEHWIGSHQRALAFFGGVPEVIVPDNLKSGVNSPCRYEPGINSSYQEFAEHYGVAVIPARPKKPRDKAKVEKAVQEVERQVLAPLRHESFTGFAQLNAAIRERLAALNRRVMKGYGLSRRELFERIERDALSALPQAPFVFARWKDAKVSLDYHIEVERHYYSVPYTLVQRHVRVKSSEHQVEIFFESQRVAAHPRSKVPYRHTTLPEHMPPEHWAYKRQSRATFVNWAQQIGPQTVEQVEAIFALKAHEEQAFRTLKGVQRLATQYGHTRLEAACAYANPLSLVGLSRLRSILHHHRDLSLPTLPTAQATPSHDNLRGASYYQQTVLNLDTADECHY